MTEYYSNARLLTLKDVNGNTPDIYISDGNRTAGKSVSWKKYMTDYYLKRLGKKDDVNQFMLIYRNKYELSDVSDKYFRDIERLFYQGHVMKQKKIGDGIAVVLYLDDVECGFAVPLSMASKIKPMSAVFSRVAHMLFDEYQAEDGRYLENEIDKLMSLHTTVARGDGKQHRRVPLFMASNTVTILNPYYSALGITKRIRHNTKILKGTGWVMERTYNESAKNSFQGSAFNQAFASSDYFNYASENVYLNDNMSLIEKPKGAGDYVLSCKYNNEYYSFVQYDNLIYVNDTYDKTFTRMVCFNVNDVTDDRSIMISRYDVTVEILRGWFKKGCMRFKNLKCKEMALDLLSYL